MYIIGLWASGAFSKKAMFVHLLSVNSFVIKLNKNTSKKIKRHTKKKQPGKPICFPYTKKQSPDQTKSKAHQIKLHHIHVAKGTLNSSQCRQHYKVYRYYFLIFV